MAKSPAFQFYAAEWIADEDVSLMTLEEEGAYIRAIAFCWREGSIPADMKKLCQLLKGCSTTVARVVKARFVGCPNDPSRLVHLRLEQERGKQAQWSEKSRAGGLKSAVLRQSKVKGGTKGGSTVVQPALVEPKANIAFTSSSSSSKELPPNPPAVNPPALDHVDVARRVGEECRITSTVVIREIQEQAKLELASGRIAEDIAIEISGSIQAYRQERPNLRAPMGLERFIGEGHWRDPTSWPRKDAPGADVYKQFLEADV